MFAFHILGNNWSNILWHCIYSSFKIYAQSGNKLAVLNLLYLALGCLCLYKSKFLFLGTYFLVHNAPCLV